MARRQSGKREPLWSQGTGPGGPAGERLTEQVEGSTQGAAEKARERTEGIVSRVRHGASDIAESGIAGVAGGLEQIRRHPYLSIGVALGTGFALGRLLGGGEEEAEEEARQVESRLMRDAGLLGDVAGRLGGTVLAGVSTLLARKVRDTIAGR